MTCISICITNIFTNIQSKIQHLRKHQHLAIYTKYRYTKIENKVGKYSQDELIQIDFLFEKLARYTSLLLEATSKNSTF